MSAFSRDTFTPVYKQRLMKPLFFSLVFLLVVAGKAQSAFERAYGFSSNETAGALTAAENGSLLLGGQAGATAFLVKVNASGDTIWQHAYPDTVSRSISSIIVLHDGGYLLTAQAYYYNPQSLLLINTDSSGVERWRKTIPVFCDNPHVCEAADSSLYIGMRGSAGPSSMSLLKCSASGNMLWQRFYPTGPANDYFADLDATPDGGLLLTGTSYNLGQGPVTYILKTDLQGDSVWSRNFGYNLHVANAAVTPDSGFVFGGYFTTTGWADHPALEKTDAAGNLEWFHYFPVGNGGDHAGYCAVTPVGYAMACLEWVSSNGISCDIRILQVDTAGTVTWTNLLGGAQYEQPAAIVDRPGNGIAVLGTTGSFGFGGDDFYLASTDSSGLTPCTSALAFSVDGPNCVQEMITYNNNTVCTTSYEWLLNGQSVANTIDYSTVFTQPGTYTISLVACGDTLSQTHYTANPQQVGFSWSLNDLTLTVNDTNAGIQLWYWDFSDGSPADTTPTAVHTYGAPGNYNVFFGCIDSNGCMCQSFS